jgi:hypothetical protein
VHTINPRLFHDQLVYIVNHADDRLVFFDICFAALVDKLAPQCPGVAAWVAMTDAAHLPEAARRENPRQRDGARAVGRERIFRRRGG